MAPVPGGGTRASEDPFADLRFAVREWLEESWDPSATVRQWWARLAESGWAFPTWPAEWGGRGLTVAEAGAVAEELARAEVLGPPPGSGAVMGSAVLLAHGTDEQKAQLLPAIARGEENWCQFFSEPGAGSDLASVQTRAVRDGEGFRVAMTTLSSERSTYAGGGEHLLRTCTPGTKAGNLERSVTDVLAGYETEHVDGANTPPISTPEALIALARARGLAADPVVRQKIASIYAFSEALRFSAWRGRTEGPESSIGYLGGVRVLRMYRDAFAEIAGPGAMIEGEQGAAGGDVAATVLTVPCHGIQGGSEQIQMNIIAERILGLAKEPQVDRDVPFKDIKVGTQRD
jgi:alkylation response protein AidB-like acyl-CoA dehydrogenase